jgi:hypothetical protein
LWILRWLEKEFTAYGRRIKTPEQKAAWAQDRSVFGTQSVIKQLRTRRAFGWKDYPFADSKKEKLAHFWLFILRKVVYYDTHMTVCGICGVDTKPGGADGTSGLCYPCWK